MSTASNPLADLPTATELFYCSACGNVSLYLAAKVDKMKQPPNCPIDHRPLKPMQAAETDPELQKAPA